MKNNEVYSAVTEFFRKHKSGTAKEIFNKTKRQHPHNEICDALEQMTEAGLLKMCIAKGNAFTRPHYIFIKINKKEPLIKRLFQNIANYLPSFPPITW